MTERFQKLLDLAADADKAELILANNGRVTTMKAYKDKPGKSTKDDYDAARAMLDETVERLWSRYFPGETTGPAAAPGEWFATETEAYHYIISLGHEVSRGKFNQDKKAGKLTTDGKKISKFSVLQYALSLRQNRQAAVGANSADLQARKEVADTEKAEHDARISRVKAEEAERERDEKWMLREDAEDQAAVLVGLIKDAFRHRVYLDHADLLHTAGGDQGHLAEFAHDLQLFCDRAFNDVAAYKEIDVEFEEEDE